MGWGSAGRNAPTWQNTIKWENVCVFITLPPHVLLGGCEGEWGGGPSIPSAPPEPSAEGQLEVSAGQLLTSPPPRRVSLFSPPPINISDEGRRGGGRAGAGVSNWNKTESGKRWAAEKRSAWTSEIVWGKRVLVLMKKFSLYDCFKTIIKRIQISEISLNI